VRETKKKSMCPLQEKFMEVAEFRIDWHLYNRMRRSMLGRNSGMLFRAKRAVSSALVLHRDVCSNACYFPERKGDDDHSSGTRG